MWYTLIFQQLLKSWEGKRNGNSKSPAWHLCLLLLKNRWMKNRWFGWSRWPLLHSSSCLSWAVLPAKQFKSSNLIFNPMATFKSRTVLDVENPFERSFELRSKKQWWLCAKSCELLKCISVFEVQHSVPTSPIYSRLSHRGICTLTQNTGTCQSSCNLQLSGVAPNRICQNPLKRHESTKYFFALSRD